MYSPLKNFIFVSIKKYRYACFYLLCKDHGSALLCCRARSHSPEIRNGGCAECVGNVAVFSIRIGKASSGEYQNCCREPFAPTRELFLNAFFRKIFQRRIFVMRKNIYVSLLFFMGCFARWTVSNPIVWKEMSVCPKKVEYPCLIIGSLC